ncbi:MAG: sulfur oxidation c-type cytochrome SoxA [Hyphomicrobium sp.]
MRYKSLITILFFVLMAGVTGTALTGEKWGKYEVKGKRSGYTFATPETRAMQDDDFANPAFLWVQQGEELWSKVDGAAGKSCASCHQDAAKSMKKVGATYPVYEEDIGKLMNVEQRINQCRVERMKAKPWKYESSPLLAMTAYVKNQSRGRPVKPKIKGAAAPFFEKGKAFYFERRGQLDMACMNCHVQNPGKMIRANRLSQGQSNAFPLYRLKWQKLGSLHRRFRGCNKQVRAKPYPYGADEYVNLELYLAWRGRGLPVEAPGVRM